MTRVLVSPDATCAMLDDGAVVLHLGTRRYFSLNETGAAIWALLEISTALPTIAARLTELFAVDLPTATVSVDALIAELSAASLVAVSD